MGFRIIDLADERKALAVNFWNWRPTVELLRSLGVVDAERIKALHTQCASTVVTEAEAREIGQRLRAEVLDNLHPDHRIRVDLSRTREPDDRKLHQGADEHKNYSATHEWLTRFADFCCTCGGFRVI